MLVGKRGETRMTGGDQRHEDVIEQLGSVSYFAGLRQELLAEIATAMTKRVYEPGEVVFFEGDQARSLYIVQDGYLKAVKISTEGREQVLQVMGPKEVFGAIVVFHGVENPATVMALERSTVYSIDQETMKRLLAANSELATRVIEILASRVLHLLNLVEDLSLRSVEARLARMLIERSEEGLVARHRWTTQAEMAARLGTVPDVLNRALRKLAEEGAIQVDRHQIQILDSEALETKAMVET